MRPGYTLRDYQRAACRAVWIALHKLLPGRDDLFNAVLLVVATGGGKTIIANALMEQFAQRGNNTLFIADSDELCEQARTKLYKSTGKIADLEKAGSRASIDSDLVVGSIQTMSLAHRLERFPASHWDYVIADEAQGSMADNWQRVLKRFRAGGAKQIGLTATPSRGDGIDLMDYWEHIAYEIALRVLIEAKHLSPIRVACLPIEAALNAGEPSEGDQVELGEEMQKYHNAIIDKLLPLVNKEGRKRILVFHPSCASSEAFALRLLERGEAAKHVEGGSRDRRETLEGFDRGDFRWLNNAQLLMKGYDSPGIDCVIPLRQTQVRGSYLQMVGRGTRLYCPHGCSEWCDHFERKHDMLLVDCLWQAMGMNLMGPAYIHAETPEQVEKVKRFVSESNGVLDITEVDGRVMGEREAQFLRALARGAKGRSLMLDARALGAVFHQPELMDYKPTAHWQKAPATEKQLAALRRFGVETDSVLDKGHASALMDALCHRADDELATVRQLVILADRGIQPTPHITMREADDIISRRRSA